jgi:hypothetical protein
MLSATNKHIMRNVVILSHYAECRSTECHHAECRGAASRTSYHSIFGTLLAIVRLCVNLAKPFFSSSFIRKKNKLECLSMTSIVSLVLFTNKTGALLRRVSNNTAQFRF